MSAKYLYHNRLRSFIERLVTPVVAVLSIGAVIILIFAGIAPSRPGRELNGIAKSALFHASKGKAHLIIELRVELGDGRIASVFSQTGFAPQPGTRIVVRERISWLGFPSLLWDGTMQSGNSIP